MSLFVDIRKKLGAFSLNVCFDAADTLALLGASGSGKSLTLACIAGILTPDAGKIILDGVTLFDSEKHINLPPQKRNVGFLFQNYALFPHMTVRQNIACAIAEPNRAKKQQLVPSYLQKFRLQTLQNRYPAQLSGGEQQRVALTRILASQPKVILLDEPFSALDTYLKWNLELELRQMLQGFGGTVVWVSHDLLELCRNCTEVCVLEQGSAYKAQPMQTLIHHPSDAAMARLIGCRCFLPVSAAHDGAWINGWQIPLTAPSKCGTVAIMDDALTLSEEGFPAVVSQIFCELSTKTAILKPVNADAPPLYAAIPGDMVVLPGQTVHFTLNQKRCFCYPAENDG